MTDDEHDHRDGVPIGSTLYFPVFSEQLKSTGILDAMITVTSENFGKVVVVHDDPLSADRFIEDTGRTDLELYEVPTNGMEFRLIVASLISQGIHRAAINYVQKHRNENWFFLDLRKTIFRSSLT